MKKLLLTTTAVAGFAMLATPALADGLSLELGGFYRGYATYSDSDVTNERDIDLRQDAEVYFTGETTLDSGLTVGVHAEMELTDSTTDEVYAYFSGSWGRVNLGQEDGAQYLLQVAAPSADSNIDGLRTYIQAITFPAAAITAGQTTILDYDMNMSGKAQKITYMTPKFNGFQAGVTWAPELTDDNAGSAGALAAHALDNQANAFEDLLEVGARWDGEFEGVGLALGAGYGRASTELDGAAGTIGSDSRTQWNVAATANFAAFDFGAAYTDDNNGIDSDGDVTTWVLGAGWDNGPYHLGVSYLSSEYEVGAGVEETDAERYTLGGTYTFGPGMSFRGAVAFGEVDATGNANDADFTQITLGTDISF